MYTRNASCVKAKLTSSFFFFFFLLLRRRRDDHARCRHHVSYHRRRPCPLAQSPAPHIFAAPLPANILEWRFCLYGIKDGDYAGELCTLASPLSNRLKLAHTEIRLNAHQRMHRTYAIVHVCMTEHIALVKRTHAFICIHSTCAKRAFACVDRHDTADANPLAGALQVDITTASFSFPKAIPSSHQVS